MLSSWSFAGSTVGSQVALFCWASSVAGCRLWIPYWSCRRRWTPRKFKAEKLPWKSSYFFQHYKGSADISSSATGVRAVFSCSQSGHHYNVNFELKDSCSSKFYPQCERHEAWFWHCFGHLVQDWITWWVWFLTGQEFTALVRWTQIRACSVATVWFQGL